MTDRQHPNDQASNADSAPDALVALYREATAQDGSPSDAARARILAYAQRHAPSAATAGTSAASATQPETHGDPSQAAVHTPPKLLAASHAPVTTSAPAANDRRWLRQALGSLAAIGLIGLLTLHHLDEPGAPQLDSPAPCAICRSSGYQRRQRNPARNPWRPKPGHRPHTAQSACDQPRPGRHIGPCRQRPPLAAPSPGQPRRHWPRRPAHPAPLGRTRRPPTRQPGARVGNRPGRIGSAARSRQRPRIASHHGTQRGRGNQRRIRFQTKNGLTARQSSRYCYQ